MPRKINTDKLTRLDNYINSTLIANSPDPDCNVGAAISIFKNGEEVYRKEYGDADKENHIPMKKDAIFRCYSMSKPVTSVAVMILVERGLISLNDPVSLYIPSFKNQKVLTENGFVTLTDEEEACIHNLLNMTAGITYPDRSFPAGSYMQDMIDEYYRAVEKGNPISTYELAELIGKQPLKFKPGESWCYSFCADVLGAIVEVVSGKSYSDFLKEEIFEPLGMVDTDFYVPEEKQDRLMQFYEYMPDTKTLEPCKWQHLGLTYMHRKEPSFKSGGAGLVSTIDDYSKFALMLLGKGTYNGVTILSPKTVEYMTKNNLTEEQLKGYDWVKLKGYGYGNLMRILTDLPATKALGSEGEFGWDGWLGSYVTIDPAEDMVIVYVIQKCGSNGDRDVEMIRNTIYSAIEEE